MFHDPKMCQSIAYEMVLPSRWRQDDDVHYITTRINVKSDAKRITGDERVKMQRELLT